MYDPAAEDSGADDASIEIMLAGGSAEPGKRPKSAAGKYLPFMMLRAPWLIGMIVFLSGLAAFLLYYHVTLTKDLRLWNFMNAHSFGSRFLFAAIGVVITFCWQAVFLSKCPLGFRCPTMCRRLSANVLCTIASIYKSVYPCMLTSILGVSIMAPFRQMANHAQPPERSVLMPRPTNSFYGIYVAAKHRDVYFFLVSFVSILSEFLPIVLSNVPFSMSQTQKTELVCVSISLVVLAIMLVTLAISLFIRYPPMPLDPRCIGGLLYYVSQSQMVADFEGLSQLKGKDRAQRIKEKGKRYYYGILVGAGAAGWRRLGVDSDIGPGEHVDTSYSGRAGVNNQQY
jgi:CrcB protein